jgi:hypothetical protein
MVRPIHPPTATLDQPHSLISADPCELVAGFLFHANRGEYVDAFYFAPAGECDTINKLGLNASVGGFGTSP